uniref:E3 ubiquitin-protein ligase RNF103 n=1 Tax=Pavo cristatus TaxID=9049 RepID=A0A8C9FHC8_PAVCR
MWLKLCFLLLYFLVLFVLARVFEAVVWYETGFFATQLVDPVALSFRKLRTILECRGLGHSGLPEKKDVRELVEKSGDLMEGELYSALKEEEASESVSSTNFSGEMHFYELVEDTKDGIWLVQVWIFYQVFLCITFKVSFEGGIFEGVCLSPNLVGPLIYSVLPQGCMRTRKHSGFCR